MLNRAKSKSKAGSKGVLYDHFAGVARALGSRHRRELLDLPAPGERSVELPEGGGRRVVLPKGKKKSKLSGTRTGW